VTVFRALVAAALLALVGDVLAGRAASSSEFAKATHEKLMKMQLDHPSGESHLYASRRFTISAIHTGAYGSLHPGDAG